MTQYPSDIYEVRLYDHDFTFLRFLQGWQRLEYHQRINAPWNHLIEWRVAPDQDGVLVELGNVEPDQIITIDRVNIYTDTKTRVYEGFHYTTVDQQLKDGDYLITFYGSGFTDLLTRRIIVPPEGYESRTYSGYAENIMKGYVTDCCVDPKPPETSPYDTARIMPNLTVEAFNYTGNDIDYSGRYVNLMTALETMSDEGNMTFGVVGTNDPIDGFEFQARPIWGLDRRINSSNPNKGTPMLFSTEIDNMAIPILSKNFSDEKNMVYVGGQGVGTDRNILKMIDINASLISPWARKEAFVDSRGEETLDGLIVAGRQYMEENAAKSRLTFNVAQTSGCQWTRDWNLGDIVTAKYRTYVASQLIVEVMVYVAKTGSTDLTERVEAEFKDLTKAQIDYLAEWTESYYNPSSYPDTITSYLRKGLNTLAVFGYQSGPPLSGYGVAITNDFQTLNIDGGPTWTLYSLPAGQFTVDGFSYATGEVNGWLSGDAGLYYIEDLFGARTVTQISSEACPGGIDSSFGEQGFVIASQDVINTGNHAVKVLRTTDGVTVAGPTTVGVERTTPGNPAYASAVAVSQHLSGRAYISAFIADAMGEVAGFVTTDYGATWTQTNGTNGPVFGTSILYNSLTPSLHIPYHNNANDLIAYVGDNGLIRINGATQEVITANISSIDYNPIIGHDDSHRWLIDSSPTNRNKIAYAGRHGSDPGRILVSEDAGDTWAIANVSGSTTNLTRVAFSSDDESTLYVGGIGYIGYTEDYGTTYDPKIGGEIGINFNVLGFCGGLS